MRKLLIASTSTIYGGYYLDYLLPALKSHFKNVDEVIFIPYARPGGISHDEYTQRVSNTFSNLDITIKGVHTFKNPKEAIKNAKGIFTGGGNTFVLVNALHTLEIMQPLREVLFAGTPYLGTSAGSNICGITMQTTNDMPIVYPPSFKTLGVLPFNINPHFLDPDTSSKHMGETRETRIKEYHTQNSIPVLGLREGSWLEVKGETITLKGDFSVRVFEKNKKAYEIKPNTNISTLT